MNAKQKLVDDVHFIFSEAIRYLELQNRWFETKAAPGELKEGFLFEISYPGDERRKLPLGRSAMNRLEELAIVAARRAGIDQQVDVLTIRKPLGEALIRKFILEDREIDVTHVERALSEAARKASQARQEMSHFIPCHLMRVQEPAAFTIGPVTFMRRNEFRKRIANLLWSEREVHRTNLIVLREASRYYSSFGWIAEVTVDSCDKQTSERVAQRSVTAALNCLHVIFGAGHTREMIVGGPAVPRDKRGGFSVVNGKVSVMASYGGPGAAGFGENWTDLVSDPEAQRTLWLCGISLQSAIEPQVERPLSSRFLDAIHWYGEAVREVTPAAKVVKYVTALERMFMTDEKDNITDTVSERVAAFCFNPHVDNDFDVWKAKTQRVYNIRSKLVHGSMSPREDAVYEGVRLGAEIGRNAIWSGVHAFGPCGLREEQVSQKGLAAWLEACVADARQVSKHAPNIPAP